MFLGDTEEFSRGLNRLWQRQSAHTQYQLTSTSWSCSLFGRHKCITIFFQCSCLSSASCLFTLKLETGAPGCRSTSLPLSLVLSFHLDLPLSMSLFLCLKGFSERLKMKGCPQWECDCRDSAGSPRCNQNCSLRVAPLCKDAHGCCPKFVCRMLCLPACPCHRFLQGVHNVMHKILNGKNVMCNKTDCQTHSNDMSQADIHTFLYKTCIFWNHVMVSWKCTNSNVTHA